MNLWECFRAGKLPNYLDIAESSVIRNWKPVWIRLDIESKSQCYQQFFGTCFNICCQSSIPRRSELFLVKTRIIVLLNLLHSCLNVSLDLTHSTTILSHLVLIVSNQRHNANCSWGDLNFLVLLSYAVLFLISFFTSQTQRCQSSKQTTLRAWLQCSLCSIKLCSENVRVG